MKFTLGWLASHLETKAPLDAIASRLTLLGLEVESVTDPAARLAGFIVGSVLDANPHPNADRLKVCRVDTGSEILQVVCGAPNARAGLKVILARPGTIIPETGEALKKGAIRGVESQGMMCSWRELGLGAEHDGIAELDAAAQTGAPINSVLTLDPVIDIAITPNRADCFGIRGIARDLAAAGLGRLKPLSAKRVKSAFKSPIGVTLDFPAGMETACPMFAGRHFKGVKNGDSPAWLKARLEAIGLRPISLLVDITNFFTFDLARPLHVFDAAKLKGGITARLGRNGESVAALNGKTYAIDAEMIVIADESGPLGLGGIIGGDSSSVSEDTTDIFLEVALFDPVRTGRTGRRLSIESDARHRFERGVDPNFVIEGLELASAMIVDLCGGEAAEPVVAGAPPEDERRIQFRPARIAALGGADIGETESKTILEALGCTIDGDWIVRPPSWRADLAIEADLIEEVLRVKGYESIPARPMPRPDKSGPALNAKQRRIGWARRALAARGLVETVTWSFMPREIAALFGAVRPELVLANPIAAELDTLRPSPLPNLIAAAARNEDRGLGDCALFELGAGFAGDRPEDQRLIAAGIRAGRASPRHWAEAGRAVDAFDAKADLLAAIAAAGGPAEGAAISAEAPGWYHPGRAGTIRLGKQVLGHFGESHPRLHKRYGLKGPLVAFEFFIDALPPLRVRETKTKPALKALPLLPVSRDFAFVLDESVPADSVLRAVKGVDRLLITEVSVFDVYVGPHVGAGKKSLAIEVTLQPVDKTLTDAEIEEVSGRIVAAVTKATGGTLRG
jgi:phenylalanyl-tRNA synthetase beta chain